VPQIGPASARDDTLEETIVHFRDRLSATRLPATSVIRCANVARAAREGARRRNGCPLSCPARVARVEAERRIKPIEPRRLLA